MLICLNKISQVHDKQDSKSLLLPPKRPTKEKEWIECNEETWILWELSSAKLSWFANFLGLILIGRTTQFSWNEHNQKLFLPKGYARKVANFSFKVPSWLWSLAVAVADCPKVAKNKNVVEHMRYARSNFGNEKSSVPIFEFKLWVSAFEAQGKRERHRKVEIGQGRRRVCGSF